MSKDTHWRLDKLLSHVLPTTRTLAQRLIRSGRVTVDGAEVTDASLHVDPSTQAVLVDGGPIDDPSPILLVMHKPVDVVSSTEDQRDRTVLDLVPQALRRRGLAPIGRLDKDTTGLLLLTDDGALLHALTHPRRHVPKVYAVTYDGVLAPDAVARVTAGLPLGDGTTCLPAELVLDTAPDGSTGGRARLTLHEGKHHQVKRMIAALGGVVTALHRTTFGALTLPTDLAPGDVRRITAEERAHLGA